MNTPNERDQSHEWSESDLAFELARKARYHIPHIVRAAIDPNAGPAQQAVLARLIGSLCFRSEAVPLQAGAVFELDLAMRWFVTSLIAGFGADGLDSGEIRQEFVRQGGEQAWADLRNFTANTTPAALTRLVTFLRTADPKSESACIVCGVLKHVCGGPQVNLAQLRYLDDGKSYDIFFVLRGIYEVGELEVEHVVMAFEDAGIPLDIPEEDTK